MAAARIAPPSAAAPPPFTPDPLWVGYGTLSSKYEDTLLDIAVDNDIGYIALVLANPGVDPWLPGEGTTIVLPKMYLEPEAPYAGIVINLPEQRLYYYERGNLSHSYPIAIGREGHATPTGSTSVVRKTKNPTWRPVPQARAEDPSLPAVVPPGPDNPLGTRAIYLGWPTYLIHGTNKEYGVGRLASRGCIRMYPRDVEALFERVGVGTPVTVVDQPVKVGRIGEDLVMQVSPTISQVHQWEEDRKFDAADPAPGRALVRSKAGDALDRVDWAVVDRVLAERRGIVTRITRPTAPLVASGATERTAPPLPSRRVPPDAAAPASRARVTLPSVAPSTVAADEATSPSAASAARAGSSPASGATDDHPTGDELVRWLRKRLSATDAAQ